MRLIERGWHGKADRKSERAFRASRERCAQRGRKVRPPSLRLLTATFPQSGLKKEFAACRAAMAGPCPMRD